MVVLTKKKIIYSLGIVALFIFAYLITGYNIENINKEEKITVETVALPVNDKVIVIDARTWET